MTRLPLIQCAPYACRISAATCAKRWAKAQGVRSPLNTSHCHRCDVGKGNAKKHAVQAVTVNANRWGNEFPGSRA